MRNLLLAGAASVILACSAIGVARAANPNVPPSSPYAIMGFDAAAPNAAPRRDAPTEGRAAYLDPDYRHFKPGEYSADQVPIYDANRFPGFGDTGSQFGPD